MRFGFIHTDHPLPSQTFVTDQMRELHALGHEVDMVSAKIPGHGKVGEHTRYVMKSSSLTGREARSWMAKGAKLVLKNPALWWPMLKHMLVLRKAFLWALVLAGYLKQNPLEWDVMVCHFGPLGLMGKVLRQLGVVDCPQVTFFHGNDLSAFVRKFGIRVYRPLFDDRHLSVAIADTWRPVMCLLGDNQAQIFRLGVSPEAFPYAPRSLPVSRPTRFVTVGRLVGKKGQHHVLTALAALPHPFAWEYHLIGDGPERTRLEDLAKHLNVADKVVFHGVTAHADTKRILADADIFALPSITAADGDMEGIPVALMEAMANGLPVVSTYHSGIPDLIENGVTGMLVDENNVTQLTEAFTYLFEHGDAWEPMTQAAVAKVRKSFDLQRNTQAWADAMVSRYGSGR